MAMRTLIESRYPDHGIYGEEFGSVRYGVQAAASSFCVFNLISVFIQQ
jgi:fructose-1,6-bisphosphatase/inositol monophosphatase family enzyme